MFQVAQHSLEVASHGRSLIEITSAVAELVSGAPVVAGTVSVFIRHTSASLLISENADGEVLRDLERFMSRLVPDGDRLFRHTAEGPDDMPAHVRSVLTQSEVSVPVMNSRLALGTWQGLYLWEHRAAPHRRQLIVTIIGDDEGRQDTSR